MKKRVKSVEKLLTRDGTHLVCSKCGVEKELTEENFYRDKNSSVGFKATCKECRRKYYQENKSTRKEYQLEYSKKNKGYYEEYRKHYNPQNGGADGFNMEIFKASKVDALKEKLIISDGVVEFDDKRKFTRLIGGFGKDKPIFTVWQLAELLNMKTTRVFENFNRNIDKFESNLDYVDLKKKVADAQSGSEINLKDFYHVNKLNASKQWIIFSYSGFLKMLKISNSKESWILYEKFIEDYFKTKTELKLAEYTIEKNTITLDDTKKMLIGSVVMEQDEMKRLELMQQIVKIDNQIKENDITVAKEEIINQLRDVATLAENFLSRLKEINIIT